MIPELRPAAQMMGSSVLSYEAWLYLRNALRLSTRELRIVQCVFDDQAQDQIVSALFISPEVVYRTLQRIYIKLHIGSRQELVVRVMSEYLAFVADQSQPEIYESSFWIR
jgi:DNA-binding CsgD family transcriptional regulator